MMELNEEFQRLYRLVENTAANVFLTGKAGTGKTTFLKYLREQSHKRMVVAAPTGVAAINAGGVTLHSLFQLPFGVYVPNQPRKEGFHFNNRKLNLIRSLDLLVIDEISMVRADLLDAVDNTLRFVRKNHAPFGGLQLLLIGDMQQLPPVLQPQEEYLLKDFYPSGYFFHSIALRSAGYKCVELKKVYRQTDALFIELLNAVRTNTLNQAQLATLNARYTPDFNPPEEEHYIHLTTHNNKAKVVNDSKMAELTTKAYTYKATVEGAFGETIYPTDELIEFKTGAQVMFIKNDPTKRFYNGKIGVVTALAEEAVKVKFPAGEEIDVPRMKWDNVQYEINPETKEVEEKVIGSFEQFPLRLAWAITIHKSQGLTFDKVILDANSAFAHGQVYVALSRCRTLEGLVLTSPIERSSIMNDQLILDFTAEIPNNTVAEEQIKQMEDAYFQQLLMEQFDFSPINGTLLALQRMISENFSQNFNDLSMHIYKTQQQYLLEVVEVGMKFRSQILTLLSTQSPQLQERLTKASAYFQEKLQTLLADMPRKLNVEVTVKGLKSRYASLCEDFKLQYCVKRKTLEQTGEAFNINGYLKAKALAQINEEEDDAPQNRRGRERRSKSSAPKEPKTPSHLKSLDLFKKGKRVEDIAIERGVGTSTVYNHLAQCVGEGLLPITEVVPRQHVEVISDYVRNHPDFTTLTEIRDGLEQKYEYWKIKTVLSLEEFKKDNDKQ